MKKWVDLTRSRVGAFNFRDAIRWPEVKTEIDRDASVRRIPSEGTQTLSVSQRGVALASDLVDGARQERNLDMEKETKKDVDIIESGEALSARLIQLESENAELKAVIEDIQSKTLTRQSSGEEVNKAQFEDRGSSEYDPLGAWSQKEVYQLRERVADLTAELEASKERTTTAEAELSKLQTLQERLEEREAELKTMSESVEDLELQLRSVKEEFQRFRKQSESNVEDYEHKVESLSEQLSQMRSSRRSHSRSQLESFPENCDHPFPIQSSQLDGISIGEEAHSTDIECSVGQDSAADEVEEYHKKIYQLSQSLRSMAMKHKDVQRRLVEAQDERDYLKSVMEDLQHQVDASSPEATAQLRATIHSMKTEITNLERQNEFLKFRLQNQNLSVTEEKDDEGSRSDDETSLKIRSVFVDSASQTLSRLEKRTEDGRTEVSEELVDVSMDIMGELANAASGMEIGMSMTYVQYAGLLAAVQKAIKQLEESKLSFEESTQSLRVLDKTLSKTLSISRARVRAPGGAGEKRLDELQLLIKEKESGLKFMEKLISDLRLEIKGRESFTLQQEVQLEYLKQQLSSSDKVISLTWEVEGLKKVLEESQRELKAQRDLNDQQRQELTIQWQSKQQAVAENLSQNHRVSSFSQQLEHVVEANEALEAEKQELEETLEQGREETEQLTQQFNLQIKNLHQENDTLKSKLKMEERKRIGLTVEQCQEMMDALKAVNNAVMDAQSFAESVTTQKPAALELLSGIETDCAAWRRSVSQLESDKQRLVEEMQQLEDRLAVAETKRHRAEQEKIGVQEILSLTSETTSAEISSLRTQLAHVRDQQDVEKANAKESLTLSESHNSELQTRIRSLQASLVQGQQLSGVAVSSLEQKLELSCQENANLEARVKSYNEVIAGLNRDLASHDGQLKELQKQVEQNMNSYRLEKEKVNSLKQELKESATQLEASTKEKSDLLERCAQTDALQKELEEISDEKRQLEERLDQLKVFHQKLQREHTNAMQQVKDLETKNAELTRGRLRMEEQFVEEQQNMLEERLQWEREISALAEMQTPRDRWPEAVRALVQRCEAAVFDEAMKEREDKIEEMHALMQQSAERAKSMEQNYQEQLVECGEENRSLQDKIEYLHQEMKERETKLLQEIREMNEHSTQKIDNLDSDLEKMQTLYDTLQNESRETIQNLNAQAEQRDLQLADVQAKAREMMKEKDETIELLKRSAVNEIYSRSAAEGTSNDTEPTTNIDQLQSDVFFLRRQVEDLRSSLEDSERTHELRNKADQVMKDELNEYKRSKRREGLDMDYVKTVLVNAFENGTLPKTSPMLTVLARLFEFSPEEMRRIKRADSASDPAHTSSSFSTSGSIFPAWMRS